MKLPEAIAKIVQGEDLEEAQAEEVMGLIMEGEATPAQMGAFLAALRLKGETVAEITGFARVMRRFALRVETRHAFVVDTCGTGGDGQRTFNISTTAAFVVAAAGVPVAKHGNRSVSSSCGSADLLECLGVRVDLTSAEASRCLDEIGIAFLFAPTFHQAMRHAAGVRREIGIRTVFNLLGPLTNPAEVPAQLLGVYEARLTETVARVLERLGSRHVYVVHGEDGLDEITVTGRTKITRLQEGKVETFFFYPPEFGFPLCTLADLRGGTASENARLTREILQGKDGACRDVVVLNAAFALLAGERASSLKEGIACAEEVIDTGAALKKLEELAAFTQAISEKRGATQV